MYLTNITLYSNIIHDLLVIWNIILVLLLLYVSWPIIARSFFPRHKVDQLEELRAASTLGQSPLCSGPKNLVISDSIMIFSQFRAHDLDPTNYDDLAEVYSSPVFASVVDGSLTEILIKTADLTRKFNENLNILAIRGISAMIVFVFQNEADDRSSIDALVDWREDISIETLVNWRDDQSTHTCTQINLTNLLRVIQLTVALNESLSKQNKQLIDSFSRMIKAIKQTKSRSNNQNRQLVKLQEDFARARAVRSFLNCCRSNLRMYSTQVDFTKLVDKCGGKKRIYVQGLVRHALAKLESKKGNS